MYDLCPHVLILLFHEKFTDASHNLSVVERELLLNVKEI